MSLHESRLRAMLDPNSLATWDLSPADLDAIRWAMDAIEKLKAERDEMRNAYCGAMREAMDRRDKLAPLVKEMAGLI